MPKSLDEQSSDVWISMSNELDNYWWIVKIFDDYLILYYNGGHYQVSYKYEGDDKIVFAERSSWVEVEEEWVAKAMQGTLAKADNDNDVDQHSDLDKDDADIVEFDVAVLAKSNKKQITYSVVYEPNRVDSQSDWADEEEIEKMAHNYLKNHLVTVTPAVDLNHETELELEKAIPVESYIAPQDFTINEQTIAKGSWVLAMHIPDPEIWEQVEKGEITGYSLRGKGLRIPAEL